MRGVSLFLLFCACGAAQQASLEGVAVNAMTGQPLSGVHVRLVEAPSAGQQQVYGAMSDQDGRFSITGVQPGPYTLTPTRAGFIYLALAPGGSTRSPLRLAPGQHLTDFKLQMTPHAVIAGRVVDEYGDPVRDLLDAGGTGERGKHT
jgi:protocatechuate 3,4-dioxygenase beta subunit